MIQREQLGNERPTGIGGFSEPETVTAECILLNVRVHNPEFLVYDKK